jgi:hypothetical protein
VKTLEGPPLYPPIALQTTVKKNPNRTKSKKNRHPLTPNIMALHCSIFPCKISANDLIILNSVCNEFDIIIEDLTRNKRIPIRAQICDIPNIKYNLRTLLDLNHVLGLNYNSFALQTIILKLSYLICILTKESESLNVLQNLKLLEILERIKSIHTNCLTDHLLK